MIQDQCSPLRRLYTSGSLQAEVQANVQKNCAISEFGEKYTATA